MPKNPTIWRAPSGTGYFSGTGDVDILTESGQSILTESSVDITVEDETYAPKSHTTWTPAIKNDTSWRPASGQGSTTVVGTENITDNLGNLLTDNLGNFIVTTPSYITGKSKTLWTVDE
jgi:hypothetical protein